MSTQATPDRKEVVYSIYHGAELDGRTIDYARPGMAALGGTYPEREVTPRDVGMAIVSDTAMLATGDLLIKRGIIAADISE